MLRGTPEETRRDALALCAALDPREVLWVGAGEFPFQTSTAAGVRRLLGGAFDAVVLDVHAGLDADVLGQAQGFVRGGGALVLRWPDAPPLAGRERLAAYPFSPEDVGVRFFRRVERWLHALSLHSHAKLAIRFRPRYRYRGTGPVMPGKLCCGSPRARLAVTVTDYRMRGPLSGLPTRVRASWRRR